MTFPRSTPEASDAAEIVVNVADFAVARERGTLSTSGLGSCVAIVMLDAVARVAALAHVLLPTALPGQASTRPAKFADSAVPLLVREVRRAGGNGRLKAKIVGGSRMFGSLLSSGVNMGERNVDATRRALEAAQVMVVAEDIGGDYGRNVQLDVASGILIVRSLQRGDRVL